MSSFEWDEAKERLNTIKHGLAFEAAQTAFLDPLRLILEDVDHSHTERRYYCIGRVGAAIATVRFTMRGNVIRIIGAGYWREGRRLYEKENGL